MVFVFFATKLFISLTRSYFFEISLISPSQLPSRQPVSIYDEHGEVSKEVELDFRGKTLALIEQTITSKAIDRTVPLQYSLASSKMFSNLTYMSLQTVFTMSFFSAYSLLTIDDEFELMEVTETIVLSCSFPQCLEGKEVWRCERKTESWLSSTIQYVSDKPIGNPENHE